MKPSRVVPVFIVVLLLIPAAAMAFGTSIRYKGRLIRNGDLRVDVIQLLGAPQDKAYLDQKYYPGKKLQGVQVTGKLEEWTYTGIDNTYNVVITFKGSKVIMIEKHRK